MKKMKVDYGMSCGRHWIEIDGKVIAQTSGDDFYMKDEDVYRLTKVLFPEAYPPYPPQSDEEKT